MTLKNLISELSALYTDYGDSEVLIELCEDVNTPKLGSFCLISGATVDYTNTESGVVFIGGRVGISNKDLIERIQDFTAFREKHEGKA